MPVRSLEELFAIGHMVKAKAASRYAELGERMLAVGNPPVAAVFQRLSDDQRDDLASFDLQARERLGFMPKASALGAKTPETFEEESAAEIASSRLATPYRALSLAVRNQESVFALFSYVAANAEAEEVREAAEAMARAELDRIASLRRERRSAYHAEHPSANLPVTGGGREVETSIAALERRMAGQLKQLVKEAGEPVSGRLLQLAEESCSMAETPLPVRAMPGSPSIADEKHAGDPVALAELLVERYLDAAEHPQDEAAMARAQLLAARAIERLAWLRSLERS